jgi:5-(carboxyamino)imidazole ribonucleotide synthase
LGRMFVHAAQVHGYRVTVLEPDAGSPAGASAEQHLRAPYLDGTALQQLAQTCHAVTTEFENVPAAALRTLAQDCQVAPSADAVEVCQHRVREKACFARAGVPCAPHARVASATDAASPALAHLVPGILKTASMGYDGKGQARVALLADLPTAWAALGGVECVLEQQLDLRSEISVIVARSANGQVVNLPVQQNLHREGILAVTQVPGPDVGAAVAQAAVLCAQQLAQTLSYVGVLCVEFFVLQDGTLVANEMAPRPHNSGHYSMDACDLSQFDLQVRTLTGLPLVQPRQHSAAVMLNLLGDLWLSGADSAPRTPDWARVLALPGARLHLYGKHQPRRGRKMGHLTFTAATLEQARQAALTAAAGLGLPAF